MKYKHSSTWNVARKLKNVKDEITKKLENEQSTLKDLEYGDKSENHGK